MGQENYEEWRTAMRDPEVVRGMLEDYRAGMTIDDQDERADRAASRRLRQPLLVLWSTRDDLEDLYGDPLAIWRDWADEATGQASTQSPHGRTGAGRSRRGARRLPRLNPKGSIQ